MFEKFLTNRRQTWGKQADKIVIGTILLLFRRARARVFLSYPSETQHLGTSTHSINREKLL